MDIEKIIECAKSGIDDSGFARCLADCVGGGQVTMHIDDVTQAVAGDEAARRVLAGEMRHGRYGPQSVEQVRGAILDIDETAGHRRVASVRMLIATVLVRPDDEAVS